MSSRILSLHDLQDNAPKAFLLVSPFYILSLGVLLLNDFVLKQAGPGLVTGKLSDFTGLFALGVFLLVCTRKTASLFVLALCFVVWKLPLSDTMIRAWNSATGLNIGRTVDPTDLIALVVLPLASIFYRAGDAGKVTRRGWCTLSSIVSLFAFTATTQAETPQHRAAFLAAIAEFEFTDHQPSYRFPLSRTKLYQELEARGFTVSGGTAVFPNPGQHGAYLTPRGPLSLRTNSNALGLFSASFEVDSMESGVTLRLTKLSIKKAGHSISQADAVRIFESSVISTLR